MDRPLPRPLCPGFLCLLILSLMAGRGAAAWAAPPQATALTAGDAHTCARLSASSASGGGDGTVTCWGDNRSGQLGNGATTNAPAPVVVAGVTSATSVVAGWFHTCAPVSGGAVRCWGDNSLGQLGNGSTTTSLIPVAVPGITTATAVAAGGSHTCARLTDGRVSCWGRNAFGQLGRVTTATCHLENVLVPCSTSPLLVPGISAATAVATGSGHTCAHLLDGTVRCWGKNFTGQLGSMTATICVESRAPCSTTPVAVHGIRAVAALVTGAAHTCALLSASSASGGGGGTITCWGWNTYGQLGSVIPTTCPFQNLVVPCSLTPVEVPGITTATAVAAGHLHTCARLSGGMVRCWGQNGFGQLGSRTHTTCRLQAEVTPCSMTPVAVPGITTATAIAAGRSHTCALLSASSASGGGAGTVRCWGLNTSGQLGNGTVTASPTPVSLGAPGLFSWP